MENAIGFKIRKVRELKNFSQRYIADKLSVSQSAYSDMENGKIPVTEERLKQIADIMEISPEVIKGFSDQVVFNSCTQSGFLNTYNNTNPIEKVDELYQEIIAQLKARITTLEEALKIKSELNKK